MRRQIIIMESGSFAPTVIPGLQFLGRFRIVNLAHHVLSDSLANLEIQSKHVLEVLADVVRRDKLT